MSLESRTIKKVRTDMEHALAFTKRSADTSYMSIHELNHVGNAIMRINNVLERNPDAFRTQAFPSPRRDEMREWLANTSGYHDLNVIEKALSYDPLHPELHLFVGDYFLNTSDQAPKEIFHTPVLRNILALVSYSNASRLLTNGSDARNQMEIALEVISPFKNEYMREKDLLDFGSIMRKEVRALPDANLQKLIKGEVALKNGLHDYDPMRGRKSIEQAISLFHKVKPESSYAWLAYKRAAGAYDELGDIDEAVVAARRAGELLRLGGDYASAMPLFQYIAQVRPEPRSYLDLANIYLGAGDTVLAEKTLLMCIDAIPESILHKEVQLEARFRRSEMVQRIGQKLWKKGEFEAADDAFREAKQLLDEAFLFEQSLRRER